MKRVRKTSEIPHLWAHQKQSDARNQQGSLFFEGATIYSYRHSWPLGRIYEKKGRKLVLLNSERYSNTTNGHQSDVDRACSHLERCSVPYVDCGFGNSELSTAEHARNIAHLEGIAADALKKAQRALKAYVVTRQSGRAEHALQQARIYAKFFGIRKKIAAYTLADWDAAAARVARIENPDPASLDRRERARASKKQAEYARTRLAEIDRGLKAHIDRDGCALNNFRLGNPWGQFRGTYSAPIALRIDGDEIVTSQGAVIPADHCDRIWRTVGAVIRRGTPYVRNGHTEHAGAYAIDRIDTDGTLKAGCHTIEHSELRRIARQLGLA